MLDQQGTCGTRCAGTGREHCKGTRPKSPAEQNQPADAIGSRALAKILRNGAEHRTGSSQHPRPLEVEPVHLTQL